MATKPTSATYSHATDANFSSGPASGNPTKLALATPAQGFVPGVDIDAEEMNLPLNIGGQWSVWLDAGSADYTDTSAHIVETDSSGFLGAAGAVLGAGATPSAGSALTTHNSGSTSSISATNDGSGPGVAATSATGYAYSGATGTADIAVYRAILTGSDAIGFTCAVNQEDGDGIRMTVTGVDANGAHYTVTTAASAVGVRADSSVAGPAILGTNSTTGYGVQGSCSSTGSGVRAVNTSSGEGLTATSSTGLAALFGANSTSGSIFLSALTATPSSLTDGGLFRRSDNESWFVGVNSTVYSAVVPYMLHKSRNGNFYGADQTNAADALGAIGATWTEIQTLSLNADQAPKAAAPAVIRAEFDVAVNNGSSAAAIDIRILDTTNIATVHSATGYTVSQTANGVIRLSLTAEYTIPAGGPVEFSLEIQDSATSGDSITVRNTFIEVRDAGI